MCGSSATRGARTCGGTARTCGVTKMVLLSVTATRNPIPLAAQPRTVADGVDLEHAVLVHKGVEGRVKAVGEGGTHYILC